MGPFFKIFGSKHRIAPTYPPPEHEDVIEPFAGAAGYATRHHARRVLLVEIDPKIAALWSYLIRVKASEVAALPLLGPDQTVDDLGPVAEEARTLVGYWLGSGTREPRRRPSAWMRARTAPHHTRWMGCYWGPRSRARIAAQVERIRHWRVIHGSFDMAPDIEGTWFVDPPYQVAGKLYRSGRPDFGEVGPWARTRRGLVIACEADGASWLPFRSHVGAFSLTGVSREVVYVQRDGVPVEPAQLSLFGG